MGKIGTLTRYIRSRLVVVFSMVGVLFLMLFHLGSLPGSGKIAFPELTSSLTGRTLSSIALNPLYAPLTTLRWLFRHILPHYPVLALRLPSVIFGFIALCSTAYIVRRWYGRRTTMFGFVALACSAWWLHISRLGTFDVLYLAAIPLLLLAHIVLTQNPGRPRSLWLWLLVSITLLYIPGMVWLVLLQAIWQRNEIAEAFNSHKHWLGQLATVTLTTLGLAPLVYGFIKSFSLNFALTWAGLPTTVPQPIAVVKNLSAALLFLGFRTPADPSRWLGHLPLLGAFLLLSLIAGIIFYGSYIRAERSRMLLSLAIVCLALLGAGGAVTRSLLVPLAYVVAIGGIAYVLHFWLKVFPRNPVAKRTGIVVVCLAVGLTCAYDLRHYYVAWPHNTDTRATFVYEPDRR